MNVQKLPLINNTLFIVNIKDILWRGRAERIRFNTKNYLLP